MHYSTDKFSRWSYDFKSSIRSRWCCSFIEKGGTDWVLILAQISWELIEMKELWYFGLSTLLLWRMFHLIDWNCLQRGSCEVCPWWSVYLLLFIVASPLDGLVHIRLQQQLDYNNIIILLCTFEYIYMFKVTNYSLITSSIQT